MKKKGKDPSTLSGQSIAKIAGMDMETGRKHAKAGKLMADRMKEHISKKKHKSAMYA